MGIRGRRRETAKGAAEDTEYAEYEEYSSNDGEEGKFIPLSLVEADTDDALLRLCEDFRKSSDYLRYVGPSDLRVWVRDYRKYANRDARCSEILNKFLECAIKILQDEDDAECSEPKESLNIPYGEYNRVLRSIRFQLCQKLTKYFVPSASRIRMPYLEDLD
jgi:hypothetical protein